MRLREDLIHPDPLLDCLVELCRLHGQAATRASLSAALPLREGRLTIELADPSGYGRIVRDARGRALAIPVSANTRSTDSSTSSSPRSP